MILLKRCAVASLLLLVAACGVETSRGEGVRIVRDGQPVAPVDSR